MSSTKVDTLKVPGANLHCEVRGSGPVLLMICGAPADAGAYGGIAGILADRYTVVTYDPRGISRSTLDGEAGDWKVEVDADDAAKVLEAYATEPAYVLGCSGGALIGFDLAVRYPHLVHTLVGHEPPTLELLDDSEQWHAAFQGVYDTYRSAGVGPAMQEFITAVTGGEGGAEPPPMPDFSQMPPEMLEMMGRMQGNFDFFFSHILRPANHHVPDIEGLKATESRVVIAVGEESSGQMPHEAGVKLADRVGAKLVDFPGDHQGFATHTPDFAEAVHNALRG
jgi:pimeloyl-ACP methyl ester carboxylesterase